MNYCSHCGEAVTVRVPAGDNLPRHVCDACGAVHYQNPKIVVGCIPEWDDRILLCKRAIEPRLGLWTLPAGFMENGETVQQGAARETLEEARAEVSVGALYALFNLPHINQVYMLFRAQLQNLDFGPGAESLEVELMREEQIPWDDIAFPVISESLRLYYRDRSAGRFRLRSGAIERLPVPERRYQIHVYDDDAR
jgi:ADP-ribose pyrophosphatase YjhB (NUDIX family)